MIHPDSAILTLTVPTKRSPKHDTSRVRYPRFEYETNTDQPIDKRQVMQRAEKREWISVHVAELHRRLGFMTGAFDIRSVNMQKRTGYWGEYHRARERDSRILETATAFTRPLQETALWMTTIQHDSCWDTQALPSSSTEVVLKGYKSSTDPSDEVHEYAALLVGNPYERHAGQRLVINGSEGWYEPGADEADKAQSMVFTMSRIALAEINARA